MQSDRTQLLETALRNLSEAVRRVIEDSVQETEGPYSWKNNKCKHGNYGYQGCEFCVCEFLEKARAEAEAVLTAGEYVMSPEEVLDKVVKENPSWDDEYIITVLLMFIEKEASLTAFSDFLLEQVEMSNRCKRLSELYEKRNNAGLSS